MSHNNFFATCRSFWWKATTLDHSCGMRRPCFRYGPSSRPSTCAVGRVFHRQSGLIRGGTRPTAPVHDGNSGANALRATVVGNWMEPSGEFSVKNKAPVEATLLVTRSRGEDGPVDPRPGKLPPRTAPNGRYTVSVATSLKRHCAGTT